MRVTVTIILLIGGLPLFGQSNLTISGKVIDQKTGEALPFATVGINGSPHGTVSNSDGEFNFYLPSTYINDTLSISYVGFETYRIRIQEALNTNQEIVLKESVIMLDEVQVNGEQLTGNQIMVKALEKLTNNYSEDSFIIKGFFRDVRDQNNVTVYLAEAAVEIQDPGYSRAGDRPKKFFLKGVRASDSRINNLLSSSLLNHGNSLAVNLEHNFWLNRLKHNIRDNEYTIEEIIMKDDHILYSIITSKTSSKSPLAEHYPNMTYTLHHRYLVESETYAIYKIEHIEEAISGKYVGIEPPYEGDTLFYSKKGWNQVIEFEEYQEKMFLKYHDVNYAFDIVDEKNQEIYLDMNYQFTFITTDIEANSSTKPEGDKMNRNKPLTIQAQNYNTEFWHNPNNAKLVPLTKKQLRDLADERPLDEQFKSKKKRMKKKV